MSTELIHGAAGHTLAEKSKPVEYVKTLPIAPQIGAQTTVYTYMNTPEPAPIKLAPNPRHMSNESGHRTPPDIVERARLVLGGIDLDPFSTAAANEVVKATTLYDGENADGFEADWRGRVFCNPPGGKGAANRSNQKRAWFKLAAEYDRFLGISACAECGYSQYNGDHEAGCSRPDRWKVLPSVGVPSAVFVCFSVELLQTTQVKPPDGLPVPLDFPICYPSRRIKYLTPDGAVGKSPPHASCLIFLPGRGEGGMWNAAHVDRFREVFKDLGRVVVPDAAWGRR